MSLVTLYNSFRSDAAVKVSILWTDAEIPYPNSTALFILELC